MKPPATAEQPLRVAIVGSGPAGFYVAQHLFHNKDAVVQIDMYDRLPTPFGLVRFGVAPDHAKIKSVTKVYEKQAAHPNYRFFGDVEYGRDVSLDDLRKHYHQIVFCTGAPSDRRLGIPGEDLIGSHPATEFVAWYNGHPDYADHIYDLSCRSAVVVGVGNVAVDVARILCRTPDELARTDIADHALDALRKSRVREVFLLGRRGPAQAAFTNPEVKELGELVDTETSVLAEEIELDPLSRAEVERDGDKGTQRKLEILSGLVGREQADKARRLRLRFLVSPEEILADDRGHVRAVQVVKNRLEARQGGGLAARPTGETETIDCGLVLRSVGYRGLPLPGLPFDERRGVIRNDSGRVLDDEGAPLAGVYTSGWIKRGPSGVIGTNKPDAAETVRAMFEDVVAARVPSPDAPAAAAVDSMLATRGVQPVSYGDWRRIDELETAAGRESARPRVKLTTRAALRKALRGA